MDAFVFPTPRPTAIILRRRGPPRKIARAQRREVTSLVHRRKPAQKVESGREDPLRHAIQEAWPVDSSIRVGRRNHHTATRVEAEREECHDIWKGQRQRHSSISSEASSQREHVPSLWRPQTVTVESTRTPCIISLHHSKMPSSLDRNSILHEAATIHCKCTQQ